MNTPPGYFIIATLFLFLFATSCADLPPAEGLAPQPTARLISQQRFYRSGPLLAEFSITEDSLMHGPYKEYDLTGELLRLMHYEYGSLQGEYLTFHPSGQIASRHQYVNGHPHGPQIWYYENGRIRQEMEQEYGKTVGEVRSYSREGSLRSVEYFADEKHSGAALQYFPSGKVNAFAFYDQDGDRIFHLFYKEDGSIEDFSGYPFADLDASVNKYNGNFQLSFASVIPPGAECEYRLLRKLDGKIWKCPLRQFDGSWEYEEKLKDDFRGAFLLEGIMTLEKDTLRFREDMYVREGVVLFEDMSLSMVN